MIRGEYCQDLDRRVCFVLPCRATQQNSWIWCSMCIVRSVEAMLRYRDDLLSEKEGVVMGFPVVEDDLSDLPPLTPPKLTRYQATLVDRQSPPGPSTSASPPTLASLPRPSTSLRSGVRRRSASRRQFLAAARGDVDDLRSWLCGGGDPNLTDDDGWAPLLHASMHGRLECVRLLLRYGARHDICSSAGHTPLHGAAANRHCSVVRSLVEAGAPMDVQNNHGNTPLHSAVATGSVDLVSYLLGKAADPDVVNREGETPDGVSGAGPEAFELLQEARRRKRARIAQRLALVKLHKLANAGRAVPNRPLHTSSSVLTSTTCRIGTGRNGSPARFEASDLGQPPARLRTIQSSVSVIDGAVEGGVVCVTEACPPRPSLEAGVAVVAALPEEVFRRLVAFCGV